MVKKILAFFVIILGLAAGIMAQEVTTPEKGSETRKAILDTLRAPVKKELKQEVVFMVTDLRVADGWAFFGGSMRTPDGGYPDMKGTKYEEDAADGFFDYDVFALFRKTSGKWKIVTYALGCTDACFALWWKEYNAPRYLFLYTEDGEDTSN